VYRIVFQRDWDLGEVGMVSYHLWVGGICHRRKERVVTVGVCNFKYGGTFASTTQSLPR